MGSRRRLERRVIVAALAVAAVPLLIGVFAAVGALDRFGEGLADANARTRVDIYGVFAHMSWGDILVGMDPAAMRRIAKEALNLEFVESAPVIFVTLFGALGTALLTLAFAWLMRVLLNGASAAVLLACVVFFGIALSSNALSSKGSAIFMLVVLIIAYRPPQSVRPVAADAGRHAVAGPRRR